VSGLKVLLTLPTSLGAGGRVQELLSGSPAHRVFMANSLVKMGLVVDCVRYTCRARRGWQGHAHGAKQGVFFRPDRISENTPRAGHVIQMTPQATATHTVAASGSTPRDHLSRGDIAAALASDDAALSPGQAVMAIGLVPQYSAHCVRGAWAKPRATLNVPGWERPALQPW
jgi:hypothetical protein